MQKRLLTVNDLSNCYSNIHTHKFSSHVLKHTMKWFKYASVLDLKLVQLRIYSSEKCADR